MIEALQIGDREKHWCHKLNKTLLDAMKKDKNITKDKAEEIWYSKANYCYHIFSSPFITSFFE